MLSALRTFVAIAVLGLWTLAPLSTAVPQTRFNEFEKRLLSDTNPNGTSAKIRGVNLGGWFVIEQWMTPSLFAKAQAIAVRNITAVDQWTFMTATNNKTIAGDLLSQHWSTFINETDFQQIKQLGLNTVRIPVPHWTYNSSIITEPYIGGAELPYVSQALLWAQKYGLDVLLDLHTAPYSQNGFDHSGKIGPVQFHNVSGPINAARINSALQKMVNLYVNDAKYGGVVKAIEILNEPLCDVIGADYMTNIYQNAYKAVKSAIASNVTASPSIVLHDCMISPMSNWAPVVQSGGGLNGYAFILDTHRYHVFAPRANLTAQQHIDLVHQDGQEIADATSKLARPILTGEFSLGVSCTDCSYPDARSIAVANRQFFETQTTAYEKGAGWIFWNWKSENNTPWSYKDAVQAQWIPTDPSEKSYAL